MVLGIHTSYKEDFSGCVLLLPFLDNLLRYMEREWVGGDDKIFGQGLRYTWTSLELRSERNQRPKLLNVMSETLTMCGQQICIYCGV